jgi:hypothetical protein
MAPFLESTSGGRGDWGVDECFVGRAPELAQLEETLRGAAAGRSQVIVVRGPAWIGKTALIKQFLAGSQVRVRWVSGDADETALPGGRLEQLGQAGERTGADPLRAGAALLATIRAWQGPAVLVIDDAHWADDLSLRALSYALRRLRDEPLLTVVAVRSEQYPCLPAGLVRVINDRGTQLDIAGFGRGPGPAMAAGNRARGGGPPGRGPRPVGRGAGARRRRDQAGPSGRQRSAA